MMDDRQLAAIEEVLKYETRPERLRAIAKGLLYEVRAVQQEIKDGKATEASEAAQAGG